MSDLPPCAECGTEAIVHYTGPKVSDQRDFGTYLCAPHAVLVVQAALPRKLLLTISAYPRDQVMNAPPPQDTIDVDPQQELHETIVTGSRDPDPT